MRTGNLPARYETSTVPVATRISATINPADTTLNVADASAFPNSGILVINNGSTIEHVNYTGKTFEGKVFDSNTDTTFKHVEPLRFSVGVGQMIKGFDEAMPYLRKGGKGKIYIPSLLGYGAAPPPGGPIKPYDHLIFEVEITDVQAKAPETK